jgi:hypothetical protein
MSTNHNSIFKDGVLVLVHVERWSGVQRLSPEDLGLKKDEVSEAFKLGNKALVPEDVMRKFRVIEQRARALVEKNSFPFPLGSARFVPRSAFDIIHSQLLECQREYRACADELIGNYERYRIEMEPHYKQAAEQAYARGAPLTEEFGVDGNDPLVSREAFITSFMNRLESYYPPAESLRTRFDMYWDIYEIAIPDLVESTAQDVANNTKIQQDVIEQYRARAREKIDGFMDQVVSQLRSDTTLFFQHIAKMITDGKVIRSSTIDSIGEFITKYKYLNFPHDQTVEEKLDSLQKEVLSLNHPTTINDDQSVRADLHKHVVDIISVASNMADVKKVSGLYKRSISWAG